jgi:protein-tyrosine phosphatase
MPSVLFVCLANRYRSPLAAAFFCYYLKQAADRKSWSVGSAGTWTKPGLPPDNRALQDAHQWSLDIKTHRSRQVNASLLSQSNLVLVMEAGQKEALQIEFPNERGKIYLLSEAAAGIPYDIPDPFGPDGATHQEIATELHNLIKGGFDKICNLALEHPTVPAIRPG